MLQSKMKDSGIDWIGEIPNDWRYIKIRNFVYEAKIRFKDYQNIDLIPLSLGSGEIYLRNLEGNKLSNAVEIYKEVNIGDLVIGIRAWQNSISVSKIYGFVSQAYKVYKINKNIIYPTYLKYYVNNKKIVNHYISISWGICSDQWKVDDLQFRNLDFYLPPLDIQEKIAKYLDTETTKIDKKISLANEQVKLLEEYKQSLIFECVTKGLDENVAMEDSGVEWIGEIPSNWSIKRVKDNCINLGGGKYGEEEDIPGLILPCISISDFKHGNITNTLKIKIKRSYKNTNTIKKGSILIEKSGGGEKIPVGRIIYIKENINAFYSNFVQGVSIKGNSNFMHYFFILIHNKKLHMEYIKQNTGLQNFDYTKFSNNFCYPNPPIDIQENISNYLDTETTKIDTKISLANEQVKLLEEYKQSLIFECVTGKKEIL